MSQDATIAFLTSCATRRHHTARSWKGLRTGNTLPPRHALFHGPSTQSRVLSVRHQPDGTAYLVGSYFSIPIFT